jgi:hypothetical protein
VLRCGAPFLLDSDAQTPLSSSAHHFFPDKKLLARTRNFLPGQEGPCLGKKFLARLTRGFLSTTRLGELARGFLSPELNKVTNY